MNDVHVLRIVVRVSMYRAPSVWIVPCYTTVTLLLHYCYTTVTLLLHYCYATVTLLLHYCYTTVTLLLHHCYATVALLLHYCYATVTLLLHYCYTTVTPLLHYCYTTVTLLLHYFYATVTPLLHYCYTTVTLLLHHSHDIACVKHTRVVSAYAGFWQKSLGMWMLPVISLSRWVTTCSSGIVRPVKAATSISEMKMIRRRGRYACSCLQLRVPSSTRCSRRNRQLAHPCYHIHNQLHPCGTLLKHGDCYQHSRNSLQE